MQGLVLQLTRAGFLMLLWLFIWSVLRILRNSDVLQRFPNLEAYRERCETRPSFKKALADQMAPFAQYAPAA